MYPFEKKIYLIILITASLWCVAFAMQPLLMTFGTPVKQIGGFIYLGFAPICHQNPERSLFILGHPMAVCSRCAGIYSGALFGILLFPWFRKGYIQLQTSIRWLCLAAVPMLIDVGLTHVGVVSSGAAIRLFTGIILGCISTCYLIPGILDWLTPRHLNI